MHRQYPPAVPVISALSCIGRIVYLNTNARAIGIIGLFIGIAWFGIRRKTGIPA